MYQTEKRYIVLRYYINAVYFLANFAFVTMSVPLFRLIEQAVYQNHSRSHILTDTNELGNVDKTTCKIKPVQKEVTLLVGWQILLNVLSGKNKSGLL